MAKKTSPKKNAEFSDFFSVRIKNPELVRKKHLHIARKAAKLFVEKGYDTTSMREISRVTGMSIGNLYSYISKKEDVLSLVFDVYQESRIYSSFLRNFDYEHADPVEALKRYIRHSLERVKSSRNEIVLIYRETRRLPKEKQREVMERELQHIETIANFLDWGMNKGAYKINDPFFMAGLLVFQVTLYAHRGWTFREKYTEEELLNKIESSIIDLIIK